MSWEGLHRHVREDMLQHGFASQTPSIRARKGLGKRKIQAFFSPAAASEMADLESPPGAFEIQLESRKYRFVEGETLEIAVQSERDGFLYIFDINADKNVTQLFPNRFSSQDRLPAGELRMVPAKQDPYQLRATKPYGKSVVVAIVTTEPWVEADQLQLPDDFRPIAEGQQVQLRDRIRQLHDRVRSQSLEPGWASQKMIVEIAPSEAHDLKEDESAVEASDAVAQSVEIKESPAVSNPTPAASDEVLALPAPLSGAGIDDSSLTAKQQSDLELQCPQLFARLQQLARRFSPVFWQDVSGSYKGEFRPWKDFFVRYDFDETQRGPNWPSPPQFQDEIKRERNHFLDDLLLPNPTLEVIHSSEAPGIYLVRSNAEKEVIRLDLRPYVYWTVLSTPTHYFFHYVVFHAEDWKGLFGHTGDLEGTTIVVDRNAEKLVAAFTLAHDDVDVVRSLDEEPEPNIQVWVNPILESRGLFDMDDGRPIDGALGMDVGRDGQSAPKEHQDIYVESKGHGQYGPKKIKKSRYIIYANYFDNSQFSAPSFDRNAYPATKRFDQVVSKHKYELVYIGPAGSRERRTLWGEYGKLRRFSGGVNPPWNWRDNWWFKTGWWTDPRRIKKIGSDKYLLNPYVVSKR